MNFFNLSTGEPVKSTGEAELGGNSVIPDNTTCEAIITECGWASYEGKNYVKAKWRITKPTQHANRVVFQKFQLEETDAKKLDNAIKMFAAIDQNATGGKLVARGDRLTDDALFTLLNKPMLIKIMVWDLNDRKGNWISKVSPRSQNAPVQQAEQHDVDVPF